MTKPELQALIAGLKAEIAKGPGKTYDVTTKQSTTQDPGLLPTILESLEGWLEEMEGKQ